MNLILNQGQIERKIKRIAYQVYEQHVDSNGLIIAGIADNGYVLAEKIAVELKAISSLDITLARIEVNKSNPSESSTTVDLDTAGSAGKNVIVVDDVLNTARTMVYAIYPFFKAGAATIKTAVLADRNHKNFPVNADFTGISLATTLQQHIAFEISAEGEMKLYLS